MRVTTNLRDTKLWQQLDEGFTGAARDDAEQLAHNLKAICDEAVSRMTNFGAAHPQYTLHEAVHFGNVTALMGKIIPPETFAELNPVEIALLILAAYFHDQGMVLDDTHREKIEASGEYATFRQTWEVAHPNLAEVRRRLESRALKPQERERCEKQLGDLRTAMFSDYMRERHGQFSAEYVRQTYSGNAMWSVGGYNLAELVAKLCQSHTRSADALQTNAFPCDEQVNEYSVNLRYLAILLRLADILDFDRDRTPDSLYRTIHFTSDVSLTEWHKHQAVRGREISHNRLRFTVRPKHPAVERATREFFDWIDYELQAAHRIVRAFPAEAAERYKLQLPGLVERTIEPVGYRYHDLEFRLSRDEIVRLLMTDQLYQSPSLCVRELLQNGLDALRHREAHLRCSGQDLANGRVRFTHERDAEGREVLTCEDNGIGMDEEIITRYLTHVGRSYYRSHLFEQERAKFRQHDLDFDPCSRFGIGFMACFMLGDQIQVWTRRQQPDGGMGQPLEVEINGLGSIIVVRDGRKDQPVGTKVAITLRERTDPWDDSDPVQLITVLQRYARACEYPVEGCCRLPGREAQVAIPAGGLPLVGYQEIQGVDGVRVLEQRFEEVDRELRGVMRLAVLCDADGRLAWENAGVKLTLRQWEDLQLKANGRSILIPKDEIICLDGITVSVAGDDTSVYSLRSETVRSGIGCVYLLDARGSRKPVLLPARVPPKAARYGSEPSWGRLHRLIQTAAGRLLAQALPLLAAPEDLWLWAAAYRIEPAWMPAGSLWDHAVLPVPTNEEIVWQPLRGLEGREIALGWTTAAMAAKALARRLPVAVSRDREDPEYADDTQTNESDFLDRLRSAMYGIYISFATIERRGDRLVPVLRPPTERAAPAARVLDVLAQRRVYLLPFAAGAKGVALVHWKDAIIGNPAHPLWQAAKPLLETGSGDSAAHVAQRLLGALVDCVRAPSKYRAGRASAAMHRLGCAVQEMGLPPAPGLAPPYQLWHDEEGSIEITVAHLQQWAKAKPARSW